MIYDNTWFTDFSKKPTSCTLYTEEGSSIFFRNFCNHPKTRHFYNPKEHNTRLRRGPENNKLQTALILSAFMSME